MSIPVVVRHIPSDWVIDAAIAYHLGRKVAPSKINKKMLVESLREAYEMHGGAVEAMAEDEIFTDLDIEDIDPQTVERVRQRLCLRRLDRIRQEVYAS